MDPCYHIFNLLAKFLKRVIINQSGDVGKNIHNDRIFQNIINSCHTVTPEVINYCIKKFIT